MLDSIIEIVKQASKIMLEKDFQISQKTDETNIVTSADLEIQKFLNNKLQNLFPGAGFYGEEDGLCEIKEYYWLIDPIDGTANFSRSLNLSVISVALVHNNEVEIGVVYNAFTDDLFYAEKGKGAYNNGKKIKVSNKSFKGSLFCTAMSLYKKELAPQCFDVIKEVYYQCNDIRRLGSCALELCYIAAGKCDLYFEIRVFPWDYAAAGFILQEAGGYLSCLNHNTLKYDRPVTLVGANNKENFEKLHKIVHKHIDENIDLK